MLFIDFNVGLYSAELHPSFTMTAPDTGVRPVSLPRFPSGLTFPPEAETIAEAIGEVVE